MHIAEYTPSQKPASRSSSFAPVGALQHTLPFY